LSCAKGNLEFAHSYGIIDSTQRENLEMFMDGTGKNNLSALNDEINNNLITDTESTYANRFCSIYNDIDHCITSSTTQLDGTGDDIGNINVYFILQDYNKTGGLNFPFDYDTVVKYMRDPRMRLGLGLDTEFKNFDNDEINPVVTCFKNCYAVSTLLLIKHLLETTDIKILFYNGKFDYICNHVGNEIMLNKLNYFDFVSNQRYIWSCGNDKAKYLGGYVKSSSDERVQFVIIDNASHLAPTNVTVVTPDEKIAFKTSAQVYTMFSDFVTNKNTKNLIPQTANLICENMKQYMKHIN